MPYQPQQDESVERCVSTVRDLVTQKTKVLVSNVIGNSIDSQKAAMQNYADQLAKKYKPKTEKQRADAVKLIKADVRSFFLRKIIKENEGTFTHANIYRVNGAFDEGVRTLRNIEFTKVCEKRINEINIRVIVDREFKTQLPANFPDVNIDIEINKSTPTPTLTPTPDSTPTLTPTPTPTPTPILTPTRILIDNTDTGTDTNTNVSVNTNANLSETPATNTNTVAVSETSPKNQSVNNYLFPLEFAAVFTVLAILAATSFLLKKLYDAVKYGKNTANNLKLLKRVIGVKEELAGKWLKKRKSARIHAIGVGYIDGTKDYCVQVFVDGQGQLLEDPPTDLLPAEYRNFPVVIYEMPRAEFMSDSDDEDFSPHRARVPHDILVGGISGANVNLSSDCGTLGYFFRPNFIDKAVSLWQKKDIYLLSNSHVLADLSKAESDVGDLILQPSPGESSSGKSVAELQRVAPIIFGGDVEQPNFVDAAIAKIHQGQRYQAYIPKIGRVFDYLKKNHVELKSKCHKFGRTTGYTQGEIFSIHLSIWVKYSAKSAEAFFKDQFLIIPTDGSSFVKKGDSGSLLVDKESKAVGLVFAGAEKRSSLQFENVQEAFDLEEMVANSGNHYPKVENYGVANAVSDVMSELKIELITS
jgi:Peptidase family S64